MKKFKNPNFLLNIVKKQALQFNKPEVLAMVVDKGFDLEANKKDLINYCKERGLYDSIQMLDSAHHQKLVEQTTKLNLRLSGLKTLQLNSLINIEELDYSKNNIPDLKDIENLTNLIHLNCNNNDLTDLKGIEGLTKLTRLYCQYNNLTDLKGIENLTNLIILTCRNNNFPPELEAFKYDISKWQEYHRNN